MLDVFNIQFKNSILYGMTYEQFWRDNPQLYYIYEEVYKERLKEKDILNWQLGQYIKIAIVSSFDDKHRCKYPHKPVFFAGEEEKELSMEDMIAKFTAMADQVNHNI